MPRIQTYEQIMETYTPPRWLIRNALTQGSLAAIYGKPAMGKSYLALDMAAHIAQGKDWHGCPVIQGSVLYCCLEGLGDWLIRAKAWEQINGSFQGNLSIWSSPLSLQDEGEVDGLVQSIRSACSTGGLSSSPVLVVIDTLNKSTLGADENSNAEMSLVLAELSRAVQTSLGAAVLLCHHQGHQGEHMRGASAIEASLDHSFQVARSDAVVTLREKKRKTYGKLEDMSFRLDSVPIEGWQDDWGKPISSSVLRLNEATASDLWSLTTPRLSDVNQKWYDVVLSVLAAAGNPEQVSAKAVNDAYALRWGRGSSNATVPLSRLYAELRQVGMVAGPERYGWPHLRTALAAHLEERAGSCVTF